MFLRELIKDISEDLEIDPCLLNIDVKGISYDSRDVKPGYIFFARKGERIDSHNLIKDASEKGASVFIVTDDIDVNYPKIVVKDTRKILALFSTRFYGEPSKKMKVIGITGTNGKSTVAILLHSIYETCGRPCGLIGTIFYRISSREIPAHRTTPESLDIARLMDNMLKSGVKNIVMEVSSHGIAQRRIEGIDFDIAGLTCIGRDHLDYHLTFENYLETKVSLFRGLKEQALALIPGGEYLELFRSNTRARALSYGLEADLDYRIDILSSGIDGLRLELVTPYGREKLLSDLIGRHNAMNILLAYAVAKEDGLEASGIIEGIKRVNSIPGRFERIGRVIVDYAHTPDAMEAVLRSAREISEGRLITVFGCGGDRDRGKRSMMGEVATRLSDIVLITSDNPRTEDPLSIIREIEEGVGSKRYKIIPGRKEAILEAVGMADDEDLVLILGKGHEAYQIIGEDMIPFDDREIVRGVLTLVKNDR